MNSTKRKRTAGMKKRKRKNLPLITINLNKPLTNTKISSSTKPWKTLTQIPLSAATPTNLEFQTKPTKISNPHKSPSPSKSRSTLTISINKTDHHKLKHTQPSITHQQCRLPEETLETIFLRYPLQFFQQMERARICIGPIVLTKVEQQDSDR